MPALTVFCDPNAPVGVDLGEALARWSPPDFCVSVVMTEAAVAPESWGDVVLVAPGVDAVALNRRLRDGGCNAPVVVVWPHSWPREVERFHSVYREVDAVIVSDPICWDRLGRLPRTHLLAMAVDLDELAAQVPPTERPERVLLARDPGRWGGAGPDRLLDEEARWAISQIGLPVVVPPDIRRLADLHAWLSTGTVVVVWDDDMDSRRVLLAAAAAGCAVVCTLQAAIPGLVENGVTGCVAGPEPEAWRQAVETALRQRTDLTLGLRQRLEAWSWACRAPECFSLLRELLRRRCAGASIGTGPIPDLSAEVTVFVTTVGAPSYAACLDHLAAQDCRFVLEVIDSVAPMSAAFQHMLDNCATPYYVQVDEDMLLYPHAVRTLHQLIKAAPPGVALVVGYLLDAHLDVLIQGVKVFRHAIVTRYPYEDTGSFELTQIERMRPDGYTYEVVPLSTDWQPSLVEGGILGLHGTHWTPEGIFERYATLERARHKFPKNQRWLRPWPARFLERVLQSGSELDLYALMGILAGRLGADGAEGAKDFRRYYGMAGLDGVRSFLDDLRVADR